jgi:SAM-dependent methyltransferase
MTRSYKHLDKYYTEILGDIYDQPEDPGHTHLAQQVISTWVTRLSDCETVLDVGCGRGFTQAMFEEMDIEYLGITLGEDYLHAVRKGRNVEQEDFNFLPYEDGSFDLVFSRHALEHSPFPLLTLMEWNRVARAWLCLIIPKPLFWTWAGQNHYGVLSLNQARFLLKRAGWKLLWEDHEDEREYRFFCEKFDRVEVYEEDQEYLLDEEKEDEDE